MRGHTTLLKRKFKNRFKRSFSRFVSKKSWLGKISFVAMIVVIVAASFASLLNPKMVLGQTYSLTQDDWSGGVSADTVNASSNLSGWNKYVSSSSVTAGAESIVLMSGQSSLSETFGTTTYKDNASNAVWDGASGQVSMPSVTASDLYVALNGVCNVTGSYGVQTLLYDSVDGIVYVASNTGRFCRYDIASQTATDLTTTSGLSAFWGTSNIYALTMDTANHKIYLGGGSGKFAVYEPGTPGTATNLTTTSGLSTFWSTNGVFGLVFDSVNNRIYLGGVGGKFAVYAPGTPGTATDLATTSGLSAFWGTVGVSGVLFDAVNVRIYIVGNSGEFAYYEPGTPGTATDISTTSGLAAFWGTDNATSAVFDSVNTKLYLGSANAKLVVYTPGSPGIATNLTATSGFSGVFAGAVNTMAVDPASGKVYIGGAAGRFVSYTPGSPGTAVNIASTSGLSSFWGTESVLSSCFDSINSKFYFSGGGTNSFLMQYTPGSPGTAVSYSDKLAGAGWRGAQVQSSAFDTGSRTWYLGSNAGKLVSYNVATGVSANLNIAGGFTAVFGANSVISMAIDQSTHKVYCGGTGIFAVFTPGSPGSTTNIYTSSGLSVFWASTTVNTIAFDSVGGKLYLGGSDGKFSVYTPGSPGAAVNLTSTSGLSAFWGANPINSSVVDITDNTVYIGGTVSRFAAYAIGGTATNFTSSIFSLWNDTIITMAWDSINNKIYVGGPSGKLASYAPGGSGTNLTSAISGFWSGGIYAMAFDPVSLRVFLGSHLNNKFGAYLVEGGAVDYTSAVTSYVSTNIFSIVVDPFDDKIYVAANNGKATAVSMPCVSCDALSLAIDSTEQNIATATLTKNDTPGTGSVAYYLSNNGGASYAAVTPTSLYAFATVGSDLRFKVSITGNATVQDVSISYDYYPASGGSLTSSKFDSLDATTIVNQLSWIEDASLPAGTTVTASIRTADSSANLTGAWSDFTNGSSNCSKVGTTVTCNEDALPAGMQDGSGDRWFQYKITLSSTGMNTPAVSSASVQFVINAAPEVRNVTAVQNSNGTVTIHYEVRDVDTNFGSPANKWYVTPMFEYWNGVSYQTITTLAAGDTDRVEVAHDGSWDNVTHTATWTPSVDYNGHYQNNTAKIRVTANDGEGANPTGSAESATYSLDTLAPSGATIYVDASTSPNPTVHLAETEDNPGTMQISSTDPTLASTAPEAYSTTKIMSLAEGATVYAKFTDAYSNSTNIISTTLPATPTAIIIQDTSNIVSAPAVYRLFIAWKTVVGSFASYRVHRSTDIANPADWSEVGNIGLQATNYYVDNDVVLDGSYFYYVETMDGNNNVSFRSAIVSGTADGAQSGGEGGGGIGPAPVISLVSAGTPKSTEATISWETDTLSNSVVEYATAALNTAPPITTVTVGSLVNNEAGVGVHSVILSGLTPEQTYYYRVTSTDINDQPTTANNGGAGYTFSTPTGPVISNTSVEQTTNTTARVSWVTTTASTTQLVHSIHSDMSAPTVTTGTSDPTPTHIVNLTNLLPGQLYFFYVRSVDAGLSETTDKRIVDGVPQYYSFTTTNDVTPPVISGISVRTQPTSADIIWTTDESADSQVEYGLTTAYGTSTVLDATGTTRHIVTILGLEAETAYNYRIRSRDTNTVLAISTNQTFTTSAAGDAAPPAISDVRLTSLSLNSASINWTTDEVATSYVDYGLTTALGSSFGSAVLTTDHSVTLDALAGSTQYYYRVRSTDAAGNATVDDNNTGFYTFTTVADITAPVVSNVDDIILMNSFRVIWSTNELADSQIEYGPDTGYGSTTTLDDTLILEHAVTVPALLAATSYHYRILTRDASNNLSTGSDRVVTTANQADNAPPVITVPTATAIGRTTATITWTTDEKAGSEVQYGPNISFGYSTANVNDNTQSHSVALTGLVPGTQYFFKVISTDGSGNIGSDDNADAGYTFTTIIDNTPPVISVVATSLVSDVSAVITWTTDEAATSQVVYGTSTAYGSQTVTNPALSTAHSVTISGLTAQTIYYYKVVSVDGYSNSATDDNDDDGYMFTTTDVPGHVVRTRSPETDTTPPVISNLKAGSIGKNSAIIEWSTDEAADTLVKYGKTIAYGTLGGSVDEKIMAHQVNLTDLTAGTIYHYIAVSSDAHGNQGTSSDRVFATLNEDGTVVPLPPQPTEETPTAPPVVEETPDTETPEELPTSPLQIMGMLNDMLKNPNLSFVPEDSFVSTVNEIIDRVVRAPAIVGIAPRVDVTGTTAIISWTTDKKTNGIIAYTDEANYAPQNAEPYGSAASNPGEFSTVHTVQIANLLPATKYHFQVRAKGMVGAEARSTDMTFQTSSELPVINNLKLGEVTDFNATLTWVTNIPTNTTVVFKNMETDAELSQGDTAYLRDHNFKLENLAAGSSYAVVVNVEDEFGNKAASGSIFLTTSKDTTAPEISKVSSESTLYPGKESRVQTIVSWDTSEPATSHVFYQEGLGADATVIDMPADTTPVVRHTVVITKFRPTTVYKFWVESVDASGNTTKSKDFLILTPQQKATVLDIIIKNFEQVFGWTKKLTN